MTQADFFEAARQAAAEADHNPVKAEIVRRATNREVLLRALDDGRWHANGWLAQKAGLRFGARLMELRAEGAVVHVRKGAGGLVAYQLDRGDPKTIHTDCPCPFCRRAAP